MSLFKVSTPASTANLGPGFDRLGLALNLRLHISAQPAKDWRAELSGAGSASLPQNADNYIFQAYRQACAQLKRPAPPLQMHAHSDIPIHSGLGSSAAALVAGLALAHLVHGLELNRDALFQAAALAEGHPDNVGPAVYGGLIDGSIDDDLFVAQHLVIDPSYRLLVVHPHIYVPTQVMRRAMPATWPPGVLEEGKQQVAALLEALKSGHPEGLAVCAQDRVHQPYRFAQQPVSRLIFDYLRKYPAVAGAFLSGSGPTIAGWLQAVPDLEPLQRILAEEEIAADVMVLDVDHQGLIATTSTQ